MKNTVDGRLQRYRRQIMLPQVGVAGQEKLFAAKVLVVGAGGLGSPALYYLSAAGIGTVGVVDNDTVDITNLQRQIIHWEKDLQRSKVDSAVEKLKAFNSATTYHTYTCDFNLDKARDIIPGYDLVLAAVDNTATRRIINQVCFETNRPWIEGGVNQFTGLVTVFQPPHGPCYNCLYPKKAEEADTPPALLGTLPGVIGVLQVQEALKLILGIGSPLVGKLLIYDSLGPGFDIVEFRADPACPVCSPGEKGYN